MKSKRFQPSVSFFLLAIQLLLLSTVAQASSDIIAYTAGVPLPDITRLLPVSHDHHRIKLSVAGDIMMARHVAETIKANNHDYTLPFHHIKEHWEDVDIKIANLEAPITDNPNIKKPVHPCTGNSTGCCDLHCHFKTDKRVVEGLNFSGLNLLLLENNHIDDYHNGREDTIDILNANNFPWIDANHHLELLNYKGCDLSFFNYDAVVKAHIEGEIERQIKHDLESVGKHSFKIVLIHAGKEYSHDETDRQRALAHVAINSGADIVIFSHAHVVLGHETYKEKYIFWGLGNFVFDQFFNDRVKQFLMVKFDIVNCKKVDNVQLVSGVINEYSQPTYVDSQFL